MPRIASLAGLLLLGTSLGLSAGTMPEGNSSASVNTVYTRNMDRSLKQEIQQRLRQNPQLDSVAVKVKNREVTLKGGVPSNYDRSLAFAIANAVPGTRKVNDRIATLVDTINPHNTGFGAGNYAGNHIKRERR